MYLCSDNTPPAPYPMHDAKSGILMESSAETSIFLVQAQYVKQGVERIACNNEAMYVIN